MKIKLMDWYVLKSMDEDERRIYNNQTYATIERETLKAYLVEIKSPTSALQKWIPKSVVVSQDPPKRRRRGEDPEPDIPPHFEPEPKRRQPTTPTSEVDPNIPWDEWKYNPKKRPYDAIDELNNIFGAPKVEIIDVNSVKIEPVDHTPTMTGLKKWMKKWGIVTDDLNSFEDCEAVLRERGLFDLAKNKNKI